MRNRALFCLLCCFMFCGCENPFRSTGPSPLVGVWQAPGTSSTIKSLAFLSQGRYYEDNVQVGTYVQLGAQPGASGAENLVFTTYRVRIEYLDSSRVEIYVRVPSTTTTEIRVSSISGRGGPPNGDYVRLHTGDGL